jgi:hypothetical protein
MFAAALGNPKQTSFEPMNIPKMDVTFRPLTQPNGYKQYVALIETEEELVIKDDESVGCQEEEYKADSIYSPTTAPVEPKDPFSLGGDPIKTFYVGSITVLGLYLLYRLLNRSK